MPSQNDDFAVILPVVITSPTSVFQHFFRRQRAFLNFVVSYCSQAIYFFILQMSYDGERGKEIVKCKLVIALSWQNACKL